MRILEHYDVTFTITAIDAAMCRYNLAYQTFTILKDDGTMFDVRLPVIPKLLDSFRWMGENNCLRYLRNIEPTLTNNFDDIEKIEDYNSRLQEHAYLQATTINSHNITGAGAPYMKYGPSGPTLHVPGLKPVPAIELTYTWTFYSKEHAVLFKLAQG